MKRYAVLLLFGCCNVLTASSSSQNKTTSFKTYPQSLRCEFARGYTVGNRSRELECCNETYQDFFPIWAQGLYLTKFLETLKGWNCPQLEQECTKRTVQFTTFYKLVYDRFCNVSQLLDACQGDLAQGRANGARNTSGSEELWVNLTREYDFSTVQRIPSDCVQIAMYERSRTTGDGFHEILSPDVPFCDVTVCGMGSSWLKNHPTSKWDCLSNTCHANIVIVTVVIAVVSLAVTLANATVLYVVVASPKMRNSQAIYKASLALGDLLVGVVVFPTVISTLFILLKKQQNAGDPVQVEGYKVGDVINGSAANASLVTVHGLGTNSLLYYSFPYRSAVGFFTCLSLVVSIYSLMSASFDRLWAVGFPMRFKQSNSILVSKVCVAFIWLAAILVGLLPFYLGENMAYGLVASVLISFSGDSSIYVYIVAIATPLVIVWLTTFLTLVASKRHRKVRQKLTSRSDRFRILQMESRLSKTLYLMVAAFTLSLLPTAVVLIVPFFVGTIYYSVPERLVPESAKVYTAFEFIAVLILVANSLWNCIIYSFRNVDFRVKAKLAYYKLFKKLGLVAIANKFSTFSQSFQSRRRRRSSTPTMSFPPRSSMATSVMTMKESPASKRKQMVKEEESAEAGGSEEKQTSEWRWKSSGGGGGHTNEQFVMDEVGPPGK